MTRAVASRLLAFVGTLLGAMGFVLFLLLAAPGDPIDLLPNGEELRPRLEVEWGLDQPWPVRYALYVQRVLALDFGTSLTYRPGQPVLDVISGPALTTLGLVGASLLCAIAMGLILALTTAGRRPLLRWALQALSLVPVFLIAHGLVLTLNESVMALLDRGLVERPSWFALPDQASGLRTALAITILAIGSGSLAEVHSQIEEALARITSSPYVDAARARGAPVWPHVLRNLLPPLASTVAERAAFLAGGVVIIEKVLLINGVGAILWQAAERRDYDLALAIGLLAAAFVGVVRLLADGVRLSVDPRLREAA